MACSRRGPPSRPAGFRLAAGLGLVAAAASGEPPAQRAEVRRPRPGPGPSPELELLERCGRASELCLPDPPGNSRLPGHAAELRAAAADSGATVVLNHWQRPAENLLGQLRAAVAGEAREVWVCVFGSPYEADYQAAVDSVRAEGGEAAGKIRMLRGDADLGVYGRFLVAAGARTRYVYIVDDDVEFPVGAVGQYLEHMARQPGVWGHAGHVRSVDPESAKWVERPRRPVVVDYANAAWFLETAWIAGAFLREPPRSWITGEDMHLSYMARRVLGLETRVVGWRRDGHPLSRYRLGMTDITTLTPSMFAFRSFIVHGQLARGPVMAHAPALDLLAYVDSGEQAGGVVRALRGCLKASAPPSSPLCEAREESLRRRGGFRAALLFSGLQGRDEQAAIEEASSAVCFRLSSHPCTYIPYELCGEMCEMTHAANVSSFNLQVGRGAGRGVAVPRAYLAADALEAAAGLLATLRVSHLLVPAEGSLVQRMVLQAAELRGEEGHGVQVLQGAY